jgi:hypothetical protein
MEGDELACNLYFNQWENNQVKYDQHLKGAGSPQQRSINNQQLYEITIQYWLILFQTL